MVISIAKIVDQNLKKCIKFFIKYMQVINNCLLRHFLKHKNKFVHFKEKKLSKQFNKFKELFKTLT